MAVLDNKTVKTPHLVVVGDGPVARSVATAMASSEVTTARWWRKQGSVCPPAPILLLAITDSELSAAATALLDSRPAGAERPIVLHCAGAISAGDAFGALLERISGMGRLHPIRPIAQTESSLTGTFFGVDGDPAGRAAALALVAALGGVALELPDTVDAALYHAACALVSNHVHALLHAATRLLQSQGVDGALVQPAMASLLAFSAQNVVALGLPTALTGPIARADVSTVVRHLAALASDVDVKDMYAITARELLRIAKEKAAQQKRENLKAPFSQLDLLFKK